MTERKTRRAGTSADNDSFCRLCKFGPRDGVALFSTSGNGGWACAKHLKFVSRKPIDARGQATIDALAGGAIR